jgi:hypothetical protein
MSWLVHVEGVSNMIQLSSPESFTSGVEHTLFIGFRPLLVSISSSVTQAILSIDHSACQILKAFILRKATFFANDEWVQKPFQRSKAAPLQDLLGLAARIPGILETIDSSVQLSPKISQDCIRKQIAELRQMQYHLQTWHSSFLNDILAPQYWHRMPENSIESGYQLLWYPDLSTANVFTYFWSFQLTCLLEIQRLQERCPDLETPKKIAADGSKELRDTCLELSIRIYQSMEYVLQEEFMLYGISSAGFPLQVACTALKLDAKGRAILETLDPAIIARSRIQNE